MIDEWVKHNGFETKAQLVAVGPQSREDIDGKFFNKLKKTAAIYPDLVKIIGYVDSIEDYFQAADFFILPSTNEGMPNVVLEAMAAGLPCVTTKISGCSDLIQERKNGFFFSPNNSLELKEALQRLLSYDLKELGRNARKYIENKYSLEFLAKHYEFLYHKLYENF